MSAWLSEFQDPVHAILGTAFHSTRSIIVIRESYAPSHMITHTQTERSAVMFNG